MRFCNLFIGLATLVGLNNYLCLKLFFTEHFIKRMANIVNFGIVNRNYASEPFSEFTA